MEKDHPRKMRPSKSWKILLNREVRFGAGGTLIHLTEFELIVNSG